MHCAGEGIHTDESDLESASYEVTKLHEKQKDTCSTNITSGKSKHVSKKQVKVESTRKRKKRSVIVKSSTASWVVPPQPSVTGRHKCSSQSETSDEVNTPPPSECLRKNKVSLGLFLGGL